MEDLDSDAESVDDDEFDAFLGQFEFEFNIWFSVHYATAARREIFGVNAVRGKLHHLGSPNLQDIFIGK